MNVQGLFQRLGPRLAASITSTGTLVSVTRDANLLDDATVDPDTLAVTDPTPGTTAQNVPALILRNSYQEMPVGPNRDVPIGGYRLYLAAGTDVRPNDTITVTSDPQGLTGLRLLVREAQQDPSGAYVDVEAEAR